MSLHTNITDLLAIGDSARVSIHSEGSNYVMTWRCTLDSQPYVLSRTMTAAGVDLDAEYGAMLTAVNADAKVTAAIAAGWD